jgi:hypothetical protein
MFGGRKYKKVFWVSFWVIIAAQALFRIEYIDFGIENVIFYLIFAALISVALTLLSKQFKKS